MALSPRAHRQERIAQLRDEINSLITYYQTLPACRAQDVVKELIDEKFAQIDSLNEPYVLEKPSVRPYLTIGAGALGVFGLLSHSYHLFVLGLGLTVLLYFVGLNSPQHSAGNARSWSPPTKEAGEPNVPPQLCPHAHADHHVPITLVAVPKKPKLPFDDGTPLLDSQYLRKPERGSK